MAWRNLDLIFLKVSPISYRGGNVLRYGSVSWDNIQPPLSYLPHLDHCRLKRRLPQKVSDILGHMCWNMDGTWWHYLIHQDKSCSVMSMLQHVTTCYKIFQHIATWWNMPPPLQPPSEYKRYTWWYMTTTELQASIGRFRFHSKGESHLHLCKSQLTFFGTLSYHAISHLKFPWNSYPQ